MSSARKAAARTAVQMLSPTMVLSGVRVVRRVLAIVTLMRRGEAIGVPEGRAGPFAIVCDPANDGHEKVTDLHRRERSDGEVRREWVRSPVPCPDRDACRPT